MQREEMLPRQGASVAPSPALIVAAALAVLGATGLALLVEPLIVVVLVCGIIGIILCWVFPKLNLALLLTSILTIYWFTTDSLLLPDSAKFVKEGLLFLFFSRALVTALVERTFMRTPLDRWLFLFVLLAFVSTIVNHTPFLVMFAALRGLFQYAMLFYGIIWLRNHIRRTDIEWLMGYTVLLMWLQFVVGCLQLVSAISTSTLTPDTFRGLLGASGANVLGLAVLPVLFFLLSRRIEFPRQRLRLQYLNLLVLSIIPFISFSMMAWVSGVITFVALWWRSLLRRRKLLVQLAVAALLILIIFVQATHLIGLIEEEVMGERYTSVASLLSIENAITAITTPGTQSIGVVGWAQHVFITLLRVAPVPSLGLGPGSGGSSAALGLDVDTYFRYFHNYFGGDYPRLPTQILQTSVEYGPLGVILLMIMVYEFFLLGRRARRAFDDSLLKPLGAALLVQAVVMFLVSFKDSVWEQQMVAVWMWLLGGFVMALLVQRVRPLTRPVEAETQVGGAGQHQPEQDS
jgi:hypothetical protein